MTNISIAAASRDANGGIKVDIPDPDTPSGLTKGNEAEKILGATKINNDIILIIKLYVKMPMDICRFTGYIA